MLLPCWPAEIIREAYGSSSLHTLQLLGPWVEIQLRCWGETMQAIHLSVQCKDNMLNCPKIREH
jgi:hypothetical protein